VANNKGLKQS